MLTKFRHIQLNHSKSLQAPLLVREGRAVPAGHNSYPCKDVQNSQMGYNFKESVVFQPLSLQETGSDIGMQRLPPSDKAFPRLHVCYFVHICAVSIRNENKAALNPAVMLVGEMWWVSS